MKKNTTRYSVILLLLLIGFSTPLSLLIFPSLCVSQANVPTSNTHLNSDATAANLTLLGSYPSDSFGRSVGCAIKDNYTYSIIGINPTILDVSNPGNPTFVSEYVVESSKYNALALQEDYLFMGTSEGLEILNVSNPAAISLVGYYNTSIDYVNNLVVRGEYAYLAADNSGLVIINISDLTAPTEVGRYDNNLQAYDVAYSENYVFAANGNATDNALVVINCSNPQNPMPVGEYDDGVYPEMPASSITINGTLAYLGTYKYGLFVLNLSTNFALNKIGHFYGSSSPIGSIHTEETVRETVVKGRVLFEAAGGEGLYVLDLADPVKPRKMNLLKHSFVEGVHIDDHYVYLQTYLEGLLIYNLTFYEAPPGPWFILPPNFWLLLGLTVGPLALIAAIPITLIIKRRRREKYILEESLKASKKRQK